MTRIFNKVGLCVAVEAIAAVSLVMKDQNWSHKPPPTWEAFDLESVSVFSDVMQIAEGRIFAIRVDFFNGGVPLFSPGAMVTRSHDGVFDPGGYVQSVVAGYEELRRMIAF